MRLSDIQHRISHTLAQPLLAPKLVLDACHTLSEKIQQGDYLHALEQAGLSKEFPLHMLLEAAHMLNKQALTKKMEIELGHDLDNPNRFPLGVLFHIGAGNMDGLPAYSVIEGLLTGNINLLKLPGNDPGISSFLLRELIQIEPLLKDYIYIFRLSSREQDRIRGLMQLSDAVVVWGSDDTISAIRTLTPPDMKIIEWGHKLSFAYITSAGIQEEALLDLARHMISTKQLLCSSCQGIYLDTHDSFKLQQFCEKFLPILETAAKEASPFDIHIAARNTLYAYKEQLTSMLHPGPILYTGNHVSIRFSPDSVPEASGMFGNCWVKPLPRQQIISTLHHYRGHLQTVGLLCSPQEQQQLSYLFCRAGAVRIQKSSELSAVIPGEAHDGEYPLRRYSKIVTIGES